jgi:hypothetical protein
LIDYEPFMMSVPLLATPDHSARLIILLWTGHAFGLVLYCTRLFHSLHRLQVSNFLGGLILSFEPIHPMLYYVAVVLNFPIGFRRAAPDELSLATVDQRT